MEAVGAGPSPLPLLPLPLRVQTLAPVRALPVTGGQLRGDLSEAATMAHTPRKRHHSPSLAQQAKSARAARRPITGPMRSLTAAAAAMKAGGQDGLGKRQNGLASPAQMNKQTNTTQCKAALGIIDTRTSGLLRLLMLERIILDLSEVFTRVNGSHH